MGICEKNSASIDAMLKTSSEDGLEGPRRSFLVLHSGKKTSHILVPSLSSELDHFGSSAYSDCPFIA